ncbi:VWA domain-containing protein [Paenibacillus sp. D2_2]|uniref:MucBP domain-containing protein n=1 Tax=Paenibacillus sp. D2_2 TaxID=3073092 RepID=UPI002814A606|nr:MucBP domain-containing protein [Paenibacillus sp. D2_2]WMT40827.1 VWA domain-containing protein [Paenibacillus sp. D2_2]
MKSAKEAAKSFANNLLTAGSDVRLAAVSFEKTAKEEIGFTDVSKKKQFIDAIDGISASGGTNIQAGLKMADDLFSKNSNAQRKKYIVLLSDGEPTYSYQGTKAKDYSWPGNKYNFAITDSNTTLKGNGSDFVLPKEGFIILNSYNGYKIGSYNVTDNGLPTISHAKLLRDKGIGIYTIGLEVGSNNNAEYVLRNSAQEQGYYSANSDDLLKVFGEISSDIKSTVRSAVVTDPMGDKFNLKPKGINGKDYEVSQGEVSWDATSETFKWTVGPLTEGKSATLTYIVVIDPSKDPVIDTLYPTNKTTTIDYMNVNDQKTSKNFPIPQVSITAVKVKYLEEGTNKQLSEPTEVPGVPGKTLTLVAKSIPGYTAKEATHEYKVKDKGNEDIFYYTANEQKVTVKYLEKGTKKELSPSTSVSGKTGEPVKVTAAEVAGYTPEKSEDIYVLKAEGNEYIFYYTAKEQTVTVKYLEEGTDKELSPSTSVPGKTGETVKVTAAEVAGYTPEKSEDTYVLKAEGNEYIFYYTAKEQAVTVKYLEEGTDKELSPSTSVPGKTGETVKVTAAEVAGYTPEKSEDTYVLKAEGNEYIFYYTAKSKR